jgi:hypothetical protein
MGCCSFINIYSNLEQNIKIHVVYREDKMDKATNYLLIQEGKIDKITNSLKVMLPSITAALLKGNIKNMKTISQRMPQKSIKSIERDAIRQIPGFKEKYKEAQMKINRKKYFDPYTAKPASIATALIASSTKNSVDDVIKKSEMSVRNAKILPIPGYFSLIKLALFITAALSIYLTDGSIILPVLKLTLRSLSLAFATLAWILKGVAKSDLFETEKGWMETGVEKFKSFFDREDDSSILDKIDPLEIN